MSQSEDNLLDSENDVKGFCGICRLEFKIIASSGLLRKHGTGSKLQKRMCTGSYSVPLPSAYQPHVALGIQNALASTQTKTAAPQDPFDLENRAGDSDSIDSIENLIGIFKNSDGYKSVSYIPHAARNACRNLLVSIFKTILEDPALESSWVSLLRFPYMILKGEPRGGKKTNLTNKIQRRITAYNAALELPPIRPKNPNSQAKNDLSLAVAITKKIESGNLRAAVRLISQDEGIATLNKETLDALRAIHPARQHKNTDSQPQNDVALKVNQNDVVRAIKSFPRGTSAGPDGLSPQHLLDLITSAQNCSEFIESLTSIINLLLEGKCPSNITRLLCGGRLIALKKPNNKIRPIAIGCTYRRIAAKCANLEAQNILSKKFGCLQVGVGCKAGAEAAVHSTRLAMSEMDKNSCMVKLDLTNAFNCISRDNMLAAVSVSIPSIYNFCQLCYDKPTTLWINGESIESSEGVQQGDPLGCALFGLTIHPALESLKSTHKIGYVDDITIIDTVNQVESDVVNFEHQIKNLGLSLNYAKCELVCQSQIELKSILSKFTKVDPSDCEILGALLLAGNRLQKVLQSKILDLSRLASRLKLISAHDALIILKNVLSLPKLNYLLRCSPCSNHPLLESFDSELKSITSQALNIELSDIGWLQATLPVKLGGLGLRSTVDLAPSAFLASFFASLDLSSAIKPRVEQHCSYKDAFEVWFKRYSILSYPKDTTRQKSWDEPCIRDKLDNLKQISVEPTDKARLLALQGPKSGAWLDAWPIASCGLRLTDEEIRVSVGIRLGANICHPHNCKLCGAPVDAKGIHALSCRRSAGRHARHSMINEIILRSLIKINMPALRESILGNDNNNRVDGCTLIPWQKGKLLAWDVTVADTLAPSHLHDTSFSAGAAASKAAAIKYAKYNNLPANYEFVPISLETLGPMHEVGFNLIKTIGMKLSTVKNDPRESSFLYQRISMAIQRGNAICVGGSLNGTIKDDHRF